MNCSFETFHQLKLIFKTVPKLNFFTAVFEISDLSQLISRNVQITGKFEKFHAV